MIERARTMTRRNNPQPFSSLFRPVDRASNDNPTTSRRDETSAFEAHSSVQSDRMNTTRPSETTENALEVSRFPRIHRGMNTNDTVTQGSHESRSNHTRAADYINPLPMPLHEMIYSPSRKAERSRYNTKRKSSRRTTGISPPVPLAGR